MSNTDPNTPIVGQPILVAFFDGNHTVHHSVAHVLSIGPVDLETGKPTISVAYPDPDAALSILSSASWFKGYIRQAGVQHVTHPEVLNSHLSVAYGNPLDLDDVERPAFPTPAGDGKNPIFDRADDTVPSHVSLGQAALVQGAKEPGPTVVSPLINEDLSPAPVVEPDGGVFAKGVGSYPGPITPDRAGLPTAADLDATAKEAALAQDGAQVDPRYANGEIPYVEDPAGRFTPTTRSPLPSATYGGMTASQPSPATVDGPIPAAQVPADAVEPVNVADATLEAAPPTSAEV